MEKILMYISPHTIHQNKFQMNIKVKLLKINYKSPLKDRVGSRRSYKESNGQLQKYFVQKKLKEKDFKNVIFIFSKK